MAVDPKVVINDRDLERTKVDVARSLESLGFGNGSVDDLRANVDQALPELLSLLGMPASPEGLTVELIAELSHKIVQFKGSPKGEELEASRQSVMSADDTVLNGVSKLFTGESVPEKLAKAGVPKRFIPHMKGVFTLLDDPATVTANLEKLVKAGVIGKKPDAPVRVAEGPKTTETDGNNGASGGVGPEGSGESQGNSGETHEEPQPRSYKDAGEASKAASQYLYELSEGIEGIPKPGQANRVFDEQSQASAWTTVAMMKQTLGVGAKADGTYDGVYNAVVGNQIKEALKLPASKVYRDKLAKTLGGEQELENFLLALDVLATNNALLAQPPAKKQKGPLDDIQQKLLQGVMDLLLGKGDMNSFFNLLIGIFAEFLGSLGLDAGPIFGALGIQAPRGPNGEVRSFSEEDRNLALQDLYTKAWQEAGNDPETLKAKVLEELDKGMKNGGIIQDIVRFFGGDEKVKKSVTEALDRAATAEGLAQKAAIFANVMQGKAADAAKIIKQQQTQTTPPGGSETTPEPYVGQDPRESRTETQQQPPKAASAPHADTSGTQSSAAAPKRGDPLSEVKTKFDLAAMKSAIAPEGSQAYAVVADALKKHPGAIISTVSGAKIFFGREESGIIKVYDVTGAITDDPEKYGELVRQSVFAKGSDSNSPVTTLFKDYYTKIRERTSFDTHHTPEGQMQLQKLRQAESDAAYSLKAGYSDALGRVSQGGKLKGPDTATMNGAFGGAAAEKTPVKGLPWLTESFGNSADGAHPDKVRFH